jgi:F-type H+-transporting ATPase subunit b
MTPARLALLAAFAVLATASSAQDAPPPASAPAEAPAPAPAEAPVPETASGVEAEGAHAAPQAPAGEHGTEGAALPGPVAEALAEEPAMAEVPAAGELHDAAHEAATGQPAHAGDAHAADAHAAGEEHHGTNWPATIFNFVVFVGALWFILRKSVASFFRERKADITGSLVAAEAAQRDSQAKLAETEARLAGLEGQVADILAKAREQAAAEHALIIEQAKADATRILGQAEAQVGDLEAAAVRRLKAVAADLAVEIARELVEKQIQPKDREEIFNRTLTRLQKAAG